VETILQALYHKTRTSHNVDKVFIASKQEISAAGLFSGCFALSLFCRRCLAVKTLQEMQGLSEQKQRRSIYGSSDFSVGHLIAGIAFYSSLTICFLNVI
jgi:hypothetical protein